MLSLVIILITSIALINLKGNKFNEKNELRKKGISMTKRGNGKYLKFRRARKSKDIRKARRDNKYFSNLI